MNSLAVLAVTAMLLLSGVFGEASEMTPFVIPVDVHPDSEIAMSYQPLTERDRLVAKDHFYDASGKRVRLWGVNLSFGANFPTHEDAERIAKRMAAFGVNTVRFHHMDTATWPRGIWDKDGKNLHREALDRLDYFIDQLARCGIYSNINLHVGKKFSATLDIPESPTNYDKMVGIFTPQLVDAQKEYAQKLLTHPNKYRNNVTYAEDYAVAIVEITNEDSLFMWNADANLRSLPPFYTKILEGLYNRWLSNKYTTNDKLKRTWNNNIQPLGDNLLAPVSLEAPQWFLEQHAEAKAEPAAASAGVMIRINHVDGVEWHLQYNHRQLKLQADQYYSIGFRAKAAKPRSISVGVMQAHEPWSNLGLSRQIQLTTEWQTFEMGFTATQADDNARLNFAFGGEAGNIALQDVLMASGGQVGLANGESLETASVALFPKREIGARQIDRMVFLAETEKVYFDGMKQYLQQDLGVKAMITGTIVFGPLGLYAQSDMDFIDSHAYWQHPRFPNKPWDPADWLIEQKAMTDHPEEATLFRMAAERLAHKPFTVTEYNHPAPLDAQAECVPMIASFAAAQDWDGVWLYTYSHSNDNWNRRHLNSFFDIDTNPAKWGFMPTGRLLFNRGAFCNTHYYESLTTTEQPLPEMLAQLHLQHGSNMTATLSKPSRDYPVLFRHLKADKKTDKVIYRCPTRGSFVWDLDTDGKGLFCHLDMTFCIATGHLNHFNKPDNFGQTFGSREIVKNIQIVSPEFATVAVVLMDDQSIDDCQKILITVCGRCENMGMQFSDDRSTVGQNWGQAPVMIEPVTGTVTLPASMKEKKLICKVLNPDGTVKQTFDIKDGIVSLKAEYGTMWYLIERKPIETPLNR